MLTHVAIYWSAYSLARVFPLRHHHLGQLLDVSLFPSGRANVGLDLTYIFAPSFYSFCSVAEKERGGGRVLGQLPNQSSSPRGPSQRSSWSVISCLHGISNRNLILCCSVFTLHSTLSLWFLFICWNFIYRPMWSEISFRSHNLPALPGFYPASEFHIWVKCLSFLTDFIQIHMAQFLQLSVSLEVLLWTIRF